MQKIYLYMYEAHFKYAYVHNCIGIVVPCYLTGDINRLAMYYFWAVVLFIGVFHRLFAAAVHYQTRRTYRDPEAGSRLPKSTQGGIRRLVRRYITLPATFGYKHQQSFIWGWGTVPTRITSILIFIFVAINVVLSSVVYHGTRDYL